MEKMLMDISGVERTVYNQICLRIDRFKKLFLLFMVVG